MDHNAEYHDPDYAGTSVQVKQEPPSLSEDEKVDKITHIIRREFTNELEVRENEVMLIDQRQPPHSKHGKKSQLEVLVEYLEKNPNLVKGMAWWGAKGLDAVWKPWEELARYLNKVFGTEINHMDWHNFWKARMWQTKNKAQLRDLHHSTTALGPVREENQLTDLEERILTLSQNERSFSTDGGPTDGESARVAPTHDVENEVIEIKDEEPSIVFEAMPYQLNMSEIPPPIPNQPIAARINVQYVATPSPIAYPPPVRQLGIDKTTMKQLARIFSANKTSPSRNVASTAKGTPRRKRAVSLLKPPKEPAVPQPPAEEPGHSLSPVPCVSSPPEDPPPPGPSKPRRRRKFTSQTTLHRNQFIKVTERFLTLEEKRLELDRTNSQILQTMLERGVERDRTLVSAFTELGDRMVKRCFERDRLIASSTTVIGEGLKALADTLKRY